MQNLNLINCGKGRDMGFIAVNGFETKISAGAAVTTVSRDMLRMMRSFDIFRLLSFYSSMAGFYVVTLQAMWSCHEGKMCVKLTMKPCAARSHGTKFSRRCAWPGHSVRS